MKKGNDMKNGQAKQETVFDQARTALYQDLWKADGIPMQQALVQIKIDKLGKVERLHELAGWLANNMKDLQAKLERELINACINSCGEAQSLPTDINRTCAEIGMCSEFIRNLERMAKK